MKMRDFFLVRKVLCAMLILITCLLTSNIQPCYANDHIITTKGAWAILQKLGYGLKDKEIKFIGNTKLPNGNPGQEYMVVGERVKINFVCNTSGYPVLITAVATDSSLEIGEFGYDLICSIEGRESDVDHIVSMIKSNIQMYAGANRVGPILFDNGNSYFIKGYNLGNGRYGMALFKN